MEKLIKNQNRFQYGQMNDNSKSIQKTGINRISPNQKILTRDHVTTEVSKVQQIFTKVTDSFKVRQEGNQKLNIAVSQKESQLKFLENTIKNQIDITAKKSASYSILNHQVEELTIDVHKLLIEVPKSLDERKDELSRNISQSQIILKSLIDDTNESQSQIDKQIQDRSEILLKFEEFHTEYESYKITIDDNDKETVNLQFLHEGGSLEFEALETELNVIETSMASSEADHDVYIHDLDIINKAILLNEEVFLNDEIASSTIINELQSEINDLMIKLSDAEKNQCDLGVIVSNQQAELNEVIRQKEGKIPEVELLQNSERDTDETIEKESQRVEELRCKIISISETINILNSNNQNLAIEVSQLESEKKSLIDEVTEITRRNEDDFELTSSFMKELKVLHEEMPKHANELAKVKRDLEDYLSTLRKDLAENEDSCISLSNQLDATETSRTELEKNVKEAEESAKDLTELLAAKLADLVVLHAKESELTVNELDLLREKMSLSGLAENYRHKKKEMVVIKESREKHAQDQQLLNIKLNQLNAAILDLSKEVSVINDFSQDMIPDLENELQHGKDIIDSQLQGPHQLEIQNTRKIIDQLDAALPKQIAANEEKNNKLRSEIITVKTKLSELIQQNKSKPKVELVRNDYSQDDSLQFDDNDDNDIVAEPLKNPKKLNAKADVDTRRLIPHSQTTTIPETQDKRFKRKFGDIKATLSQQTVLSFPDERSDNCSTTNFEDTLFGEKKYPVVLKKPIISSLGKSKVPHNSEVPPTVGPVMKTSKLVSYGGVSQSSKPISSCRVSNTAVLPKWSKETKVNNTCSNNKVSSNTYSVKKKSTKSSPGDWFDEDDLFL